MVALLVVNDPGDSSFLFFFFFPHLKHEGYFDRSHLLISRLEHLVSLPILMDVRLGDCLVINGTGLK